MLTLAAVVCCLGTIVANHLQIADGDSKNGNNRQWFDLLGRSRIDHRKAANPQWNGIYVKDGRKVVVTSTER
jgi:hypothetical protein